MQNSYRHKVNERNDNENRAQTRTDAKQLFILVKWRNESTTETEHEWGRAQNSYRRKLNERRRTKERGGSARRGEREEGSVWCFANVSVSLSLFFPFSCASPICRRAQEHLFKPWQFGNAIFFSCGSWPVLVLVSLLWARHARHSSSLQNGGDSTPQKSERRWYWRSIRDGGAKFSSCSSRGFCTWCWREFISRVDGQVWFPSFCLLLFCFAFVQLWNALLAILLFRLFFVSFRSLSGYLLSFSSVAVTPFFPWLLMQVKPCGYATLNPKP